MLEFEKAKPSPWLTIVFYDWDDTVIGSLTVRRDRDERARINAYIEENMIHPDLRKYANVAGLEREKTYRGAFPATPGPPGSPPSATDGEKYPLTNKLDYAFVRKGHFAADGTLILGDVDENDPYPYLGGWALCEKGKPAPWTTAGTGELTDARHE